MEAFCEVGAADICASLRARTRTFCTLLGKVLPTQVTADSNNPIHAIDRIEVVVSNPREQHSPKAVRG